MLKISLYHNFCSSSSVIVINHNTYDYRKNQSYTADRQTTSATGRGLSPRQEPRFPYALSRNITESQRSDLQRSWGADRNDTYLRQFMDKAIRDRGYQRSGDTTRTRTQANHGLLGRRSRAHCHRERPTEREESERGVATGIRQGGEREYLQGFFIRIGARYRRIRKRPKGKPSPQLYAYKTEKLQELEQQAIAGTIDLYYGDESHICTEGYVPYGWQFRGEDVCIPSERGLRLNIFGMIDRHNRYEGSPQRRT